MALPRLQARYTAFVVSLFIGVLWGLRHVPLFWVKGAPLAPLLFAAFFIDTGALVIWLTWLQTVGKVAC